MQGNATTTAGQPSERPRKQLPAAACEVLTEVGVCGFTFSTVAAEPVRPAKRCTASGAIEHYF